MYTPISAQFAKSIRAMVESMLPKLVEDMKVNGVTETARVQLPHQPPASVRVILAELADQPALGALTSQ